MTASLAVHALLFIVAGAVLLADGGRRELIRVSLWVGSGGEAASEAEVPATSQGRDSVRPERRERVRPESKDAPHFDSAPLRSARAEPRVHPSSVQGEGPSAGGAGTGPGAGDGRAQGQGLGQGHGLGDGGDRRPFCVRCPEPRYPYVARTRGWQGTVDVGLAVRADGSVDVAAVRRSSGYGLLDRAAVDAARRSRFQPAPSPEPVRGFIEYRFQLAGNERH